MRFETKFIARKMMVLALATYGLALTACSTAAVPYSNPDQADTSWEAYQDCLASLPKNSNANVCNNVGTQAASSQTNYLNSGMYVDSNGNLQSSTSGTATSGSSGPMYKQTMTAAQLQAAYAASYKSYLTTVDAKDLAEMTAQWRSIASEARGQAN